MKKRVRITGITENDDYYKSKDSIIGTIGLLKDGNGDNTKFCPDDLHMMLRMKNNGARVPYINDNYIYLKDFTYEEIEAEKKTITLEQLNTDPKYREMSVEELAKTIDRLDYTDFLRLTGNGSYNKARNLKEKWDKEDRYYFKRKSVGVFGECLEICPVLNETARIGSGMCRDCNENKGWCNKEFYVICNKLNEFINQNKKEMKEFKKEDLKNGYLFKVKDNNEWYVFADNFHDEDTDCFAYEDGSSALVSELGEITTVARGVFLGNLMMAFKDNKEVEKIRDFKVIFERKEIPEYTMEELREKYVKHEFKVKEKK